MITIRNFLLIFLGLQIQSNWATESFPEPIDFVYIWVDGDDPEWLKIKNEHADHCEVEKTVSDALLECRFTDHDELKYSLRSIWKYAPFFNHIYIVTMNQKPKWLLDHPKITIVDHKEIFRDLSHLPTFNSQAIESNIAAIPNLQEYFIYLNDDFFLAKEVIPSDFFSTDGKIKVLFEKWISPTGPQTTCESSYRLAWRNTNERLNNAYYEVPRYRLCHAPYAMRKSLIIKTMMEFPDVFTLTSSHRFRCAQDYNITNGFLQYHWYYFDWIESGSITNKLVDIHSQNDSNLDKTMQELNKVRKAKPHTFCIEDNLHGKNPLTEQVIQDFFDLMFPNPAPWEKQP